MAAALALIPARGLPVEEASVTLGGRPQTVELYRPDHPVLAVVLSSGDFGWAGFVVDVAEFLKSRQVAVLGFNTKTYLESFSHGKSALDPAQVPGHYHALARETERLLGVSGRPVLVGISEGAGLSVIAAASETERRAFKGVICLGLPDTVELGWHAWRDWTIWITKGSPNEPHANLMDYVAKVAPLPLALVQSTKDEFVPLATARALFAAASEPKKLHLIEASNHRFSDKRDELKRRLIEALSWLDTPDRP